MDELIPVGQGDDDAEVGEAMSALA
jgi:hypothetical protein